MQPTVVHTSTIDVVNALAQLGLTPDILIESIRRGEIGRDSCTKNDPPNAPGFYAWAGTVRALRDILMPQKWMRNDEDCYPRVINADKTIAITVVTGDDGTGKSSANPKTKYPKGAATQAAISCNQQSLRFEEFPPIEDEADETAETWITWMLLRKRTGDSVFAELSLPSSMTKDGQVESWQTRIILDPILIDPNIEVEDDSSEPPIDVPVRRRS
jgi:hypothetical protein